jgi:hypothetical protein
MSDTVEYKDIIGDFEDHEQTPAKDSAQFIPLHQISSHKENKNDNVSGQTTKARYHYNFETKKPLKRHLSNHIWN